MRQGVSPLPLGEVAAQSAAGEGTVACERRLRTNPLPRPLSRWERGARQSPADLRFAVVDALVGIATGITIRIMMFPGRVKLD